MSDPIAAPKTLTDPPHQAAASGASLSSSASLSGGSAAPASSGPAAVAGAFAKLDSSPGGLPGADIPARLARYGRNVIEAHTESRWRKLASYFWGPFPWMIEAAALISALRRDWPDFAVVAGLLIYNAAVGFWQDNKAANALAALQKGLAPKARVLRDGAMDLGRGRRTRAWRRRQRHRRPDPSG